MTNALAHDDALNDDEIYYPIRSFHEQRDVAHFFPPENFHANGMSAHRVAVGILGMLGIDPGPIERSRRRVAWTTADLKSLFGFSRAVKVWHYDYSWAAARVLSGQPRAVRRYYRHATDFRLWSADRPLTDGSAMILSDSFGFFVARHLAPAFRRLVHINMYYMTSAEIRGFSKFIDSERPRHLIFLFHDGVLVAMSHRMIRAIGLRHAKVTEPTTGSREHVTRQDLGF